jgi:biopolymer transport protein ExbD
MKSLLALFMLFSSGLCGQSSIADPIITGSVNSRPFFQFLLKKNGSVFYNYDSTDLDRGLIAIGKPTKMKLVEVLNTIEKKYQLKLTEDDIIITEDAQVVYRQFKQVKEALKKKQLFKFRVITIAKPGNDSPVNVEKEVENNVILVSQKTLCAIPPIPATRIKFLG